MQQGRGLCQAAALGQDCPMGQDFDGDLFFGTEPMASSSQDAPTPAAGSEPGFDPSATPISVPLQDGEAWSHVPADFYEKHFGHFRLEDSVVILASASSVSSEAVSERFLGDAVGDTGSSIDMQNRDLRRTECRISQAQVASEVEARRKELRSTSVRFRQLAMKSLSRSASGSSPSSPVRPQMAEIVGSRGGEEVGVRGCGVGGLLVHESTLRSDHEPSPKGKGKDKGKRSVSQ